MNKVYWYLCSFTVAVLCLLALSPLVIPAGEVNPVIWGLPRTLWAGLVIYIAMVLLTVVGVRIHPDRGITEGDEH